jgi:hypothetical protein
MGSSNPFLVTISCCGCSSSGSDRIRAATSYSVLVYSVYIVCISIYMCMYVCGCVCMYVYVCICMCVYVCVCMYVCMCVYMCVCMYVYVYFMCVYGSYLRSFPLSQLRQTLLPRPHTSVDDLQEELACSRVENEDRSVDGLGDEVSFECLVGGDAVHVGVVHEPYDLVGEEFGVVLGGQVGLCGEGV